MIDPHAPTPPNRLKLATVSLRIGAVFYALLGVGVLVAAVFVDPPDTTPSDRWFFLGMLVFLGLVSLGMAAASELIVWGLARRRMWAWVAGLCVFGLYVPSLFFPLGALGLWGLLDPGSRALFGMGAGAAQPGTTPGGPVRSGRGPGCAIAAVIAVVGLVMLLPVIGILAAIAIPNFIDARAKAQQVRTLSDLRAISVAIETARANTGSLPANTDIESVLSEVREHSGSQLSAADAWGHPYRYSCWSEDGSPGCTSYAVVSAGSDGVFEHDDPRDYRSPRPPPASPGIPSYDVDLAIVDGLVVRDRY
jgi:type II secretory pathway pseudopilin PulG